MLGLLGLFLVLAIVSLLGEALAPRGLPGGLAGAFLGGLLGGAQAVAIVVGLFHLGARALAKKAPAGPELAPFAEALEAHRIVAKRSI